jgi:hydroxyacylglutathione hydrolase
MEVVPVPSLSDNYAYLLIDKSTGILKFLLFPIDADRSHIFLCVLLIGIAAAIDPVEPEKVIAAARAHNVQIKAILTTHAHWDHAGGNKSLKETLENGQSLEVPVIGGQGDNVQAVTQEVGHNDSIQVGTLNIRVYLTPCHTRGHVLYHVNDALFTGDTLFIAGCGRFFNGTPAEMHYALNKVIALLPHDTKIYCGHEYTYSNLKFARHVEPCNEAIKTKLEWARKQQESNLPTIPSTVSEELQTNPFMRVMETDVQKFAGSSDPEQTMGILRTAKDAFGVGKGKI